MKEESLWVESCPLCRIFSHGELNTTLYWPESKEEIKDSEFVIVESPDRHIPMIIYKDHVFTVLNQSWGRMLYRARKIFGISIKVNIKMTSIQDHWHAYIIKEEY